MSGKSVSELFASDSLIDDEERAVVGTARRVGDKRLRSEVTKWFETGAPPVRDLALELGGLGLFGMHQDGYGCAGTSATSYRSHMYQLTIGKALTGMDGFR